MGGETQRMNGLAQNDKSYNWGVERLLWEPKIRTRSEPRSGMLMKVSQRRQYGWVGEDAQIENTGRSIPCRKPVCQSHRNEKGHGPEQRAGY